MSIKVAILDDHPLAINGIRIMLDKQSDIEITDTYTSAGALLEGLAKRQPDVLLLDIVLPGMSGKELAPVIAKEYPDIAIVALTSLDAPAVVKSMMQRGCMGYLLKDTDQETMIAAIHHAYKKEKFIEPSLKEVFMQNMMNYKKNMPDVALQLTHREKEILQLIVEECTTQEIADKLCISFRTVENHRYSLLQKLDVKNTAGLVKTAILLGLVE